MRRRGLQGAVLETCVRQLEAIALYRSEGYFPIPLFGEYRDLVTSRCLL